MFNIFSCSILEYIKVASFHNSVSNETATNSLCNIAKTGSGAISSNFLDPTVELVEIWFDNVELLLGVEAS